MPIQPIDLLTAFGKMEQIGNQQASDKNALLSAQAVEAQELVAKSEAQTHDVTQTNDAGEGAEQSDEDGKGDSRRPSHKKNKAQAAPKEKKTISDPDLGHHIDISG